MDALSASVAALWQLEPRARSGEPEAVHDMRVAVRRLRSFLWGFSDHLPAALVEQNGGLRWLGRVLGQERDLDVQVEALGARGREDPRWQPLLDHVDLERQVMEGRLVVALTSERFDRLMHAVTAAAVDAKLPTGGDAVERARKRVRNSVATLSLDSSNLSFHVLRKEVKRLRYLLEAAGEPVDDLKMVQKELGKLQDLETEQLMLGYWLRWPDLPAETVEAGEDRLGELHAEIREQRKSILKGVGRLR